MAIENNYSSRLSALAVGFLLTLGGCSGEGDEKEPDTGESSSGASASTVFDNRITGSVGDGPIVGARIRIRSASGAILSETTSGQTADYDLVVKTEGRNYPLTIEADQGTDLVTGRAPDFRLATAITRPSNRSTSNINPFTTLIVAAAKHNGLGDSTLATARANVVSRYGFGLDTRLIADPISTPITNSNVHAIVKSSETLGEMIRRTRDALYAAGSNMDGDAIITALAADLSDGWLDGRGARGSNARVAAVATVASAAVLVEAMTNRLQVYGVNATAAMDQSIRIVRPSAPQSAVTSNVPISAAAFQQTARALRAAELINPEPRIAEAIQVMESATSGSLPAAISPRLPSGLGGVLDAAVARAATATNTQIEAINATARSGSAPAPGSGASGPSAVTPETNVLVVGIPWSFQPSTAGLPSGTLSFSIQGRPAWASFDTTNGRLNGTPPSVGVFGPITISASDGRTQTPLADFTLHVTEPSLGSATIILIPPTERTDGSALTRLDGYRIYFGKDRSSMTHFLTISNPGQTTHFIENLDRGTWYFAATAFADGLESPWSNIGSKTFQ